MINTQKKTNFRTINLMIYDNKIKVCCYKKGNQPKKMKQKKNISRRRSVAF